MERMFEMADGCKIMCAGRGKTKKEIIELQKEEWTQKHGGICGIVELTEPRAIFFAQKFGIIKELHRGAN